MNKNLIVSTLILLLVLGIGFFIMNNNANKEGEFPDITSPEPTNNPKEFGDESLLGVGETMVFADGLNVKLKRIDDSRCKEGVVCIWQGELSALVDVSGGKIVTPAELVLSTERFKNQHMDGYTFTLQSATESSITLSVIYEVPVFTSGGCFVGGCSGQICSDEQDVMSNCEYREEYACYKSARCERQSSGKCGWTSTPSLQACLGKGK